MKTFSFKNWFFYTIGATLALSFLYLFSVYYLFVSYSGDSIWIKESTSFKESLARNIPGNKIVFLGGSATLQGIRTKDIQQKLRVPCVNLGIHAGLEMDYLLYWGKRSLKSGDIVIFPVEYPYFLYDGKLKNLTLEYVFTYDKKFLETMPLSQRIKYAAGIPPHKLGKSLAQTLFLQNRQGAREGYNVSTLNENGDDTCNVGQVATDSKLRFASPFLIQSGEFKETPGLKMLKDFNTWCKINNISFYISFANTLYYKEYDSKPYRDYFTNLERYFLAHDIAVIGTPADFFYNLELFYDSQYHLNQAGVTLRTNQLISILCNLNITKPLGNRLSGASEQDIPGSRLPVFCREDQP